MNSFWTNVKAEVEKAFHPLSAEVEALTARVLVLEKEVAAQAEALAVDAERVVTAPAVELAKLQESSPAAPPATPAAVDPRTVVTHT